MSAVERIELIRAGTPGMDMQGYPVLANVVRGDKVLTRGSVEAGNTFYRSGLDAPRVAGEMAWRSGERLIELSSSVEQMVDDEVGAGRRWRVSPQGELIGDGRYSEEDSKRIAAAAAGYENAALGGKLHVHGSLQQTRISADVLEHLTVPVSRITAGAEFGDETASELGMHFERALSSVSGLEVLAIRLPRTRMYAWTSAGAKPSSPVPGTCVPPGTWS